MRTELPPERLADPDVAESNKALRACVHCGFCQSTCPTYVLLGDELDSPRGRIYLIKNMLEGDGEVPERVVRHVDRCLSCLACQTTCPSGVHYMHLVDHARSWIEAHHRRPWRERWLRSAIGWLIPRPRWFRWALRLAALGRWLPGRLGRMARLAPAAREADPHVPAPPASPRLRVGLLVGCVQQVLGPHVHAATQRVLARHGVEVVPLHGCCGAVPHHLGQADRAHAHAAAAVDGWDLGDLDAIVANVAGCGTMLRDYGHLLRTDDQRRDRAAHIAALARDVSEVLADCDLSGDGTLTVAYQSACSLQHGQGVRAAPVELLRAAGFTVVEPAESHLCCGSAGTYNLLQPDLAGRLRDRKVAALRALDADVVASGNVGCITWLAPAAGVPIVHTAELLDWATGGPQPPDLS